MTETKSMSEPTTPPQSTTTCSCWIVELADGATFLAVEIVIDCPDCGRQVVRLAGHHLRPIRDFLMETIDREPELTGRADGYRVGRQTTQKGSTGDPSTN